MMFNSNPLPIKSSRYFQTNCISKMNRMRMKVRMNGPKKDLMIRRLSFRISCGELIKA